MISLTVEVGNGGAPLLVLTADSDNDSADLYFIAHRTGAAVAGGLEVRNVRRVVLDGTNLFAQCLPMVVEYVPESAAQLTFSGVSEEPAGEVSGLAATVPGLVDGAAGA